MYDTLCTLDMLFIVYVGEHKLEYMKNMVPSLQLASWKK